MGNIETPLECTSPKCKKPIIGRGVVVCALDEDNNPTEPGAMHPTCFEELIHILFTSEATALFQIGIGSVQDIWVGMNTDSDEEAGISD